MSLPGTRRSLVGQADRNMLLGSPWIRSGVAAGLQLDRQLSTLVSQTAAKGIPMRSGASSIWFRNRRKLSMKQRTNLVDVLAAIHHNRASPQGYRLSGSGMCFPFSPLPGITKP